MGDGLGWWRPRNALWLLVLIGSGLTCPARVPGASVSGLSVSDTRGREIMAVVRESGRAAVTEVWVRRSGADDRYLGSIPGTADALCWSADGSLLIRLRPLALPMMGLTVMPVRDWRLCDDAVWQIDPERGRARRGESTVAFGPAQPVGRLPLRAQADRQMELRLVDAALNLASAGYSFMQSWDFKAAERRYKSAAKAFGDLLDGSGGVHFLEMPVKAYREAIQSMARTADRAAPRWVCREHLQTIGDLLKAYGADRDGARPPSLAALRDWLESLGTSADDAKLMGRLFRPYRDWEPGRTLAYYYLPEAEDGSAVLTSFFHKGYLVELVGAGPDYRVSDRRIGRVHVDSLMNVGRYHYDTQSDSSEAIAVYEVVTGIVPDFAEGHCQLGYAHLKVGNLRRALRAFERAVACDDRLPEAYLGLGLLFRRWPRGDYDAIRYFQKALQFRRDYVEARYNIAEIRFKLEELDAKKDIDKVLAINRL